MFEKEYPENHGYTASLKAYFNAIANSEIEYTGVLIHAFRENFMHPTLQVGDILVEYDGKTVTSIEQLSAAYKNNVNAPFTVLRLDNGSLKPVRIERLDNPDDVGFMNFVFGVEEALTEG